MRFYILLISICLAAAGVSQASVVTIDATAKTVRSDSGSLEPFYLQVMEQQVGICVNNKIVQPQIFTLKVSGLIEPKYDLYINGAYKGTKSLKQVTQGLSFRVEGRITDPAMMRCLEVVKPKVQAVYDKLKSEKDAEIRLGCDTLSQAVLWSKLPLALEQDWRSVRIILAPASRPLQKMEWTQRGGAEDTAGAITNACWLLQQGRHRMSIQIKNAELRDQVVDAMTPITLAAAYATRAPRPRVYVKLLNECNLPVSGTVTLALPEGWKHNAKTLSFSQLKSGKAFVVLCDLIPPRLDAAAPESITAAASLFLVQLDQPARYGLKTTAKAKRS